MPEAICHCRQIASAFAGYILPGNNYPGCQIYCCILYMKEVNSACNVLQSHYIPVFPVAENCPAHHLPVHIHQFDPRVAGGFPQGDDKMVTGGLRINKNSPVFLIRNAGWISDYSNGEILVDIYLPSDTRRVTGYSPAFWGIPASVAIF